MKNILHYIIYSTFLISSIQSFGQKNIPVWDFNDLNNRLNNKSDTIHIISFWATWCKPCLEELPAFERVTAEYSDNEVKVLLVSMDFPEELETRLIPFVKKKEIKSSVVLLDAPNPNKWINKVDNNWSGAIPATIVMSNNGYKFFEKQLSYDDLKHLIINHK